MEQIQKINDTTIQVVDPITHTLEEIEENISSLTDDVATKQSNYDNTIANLSAELQSAKDELAKWQGYKDALSENA